MEFPVGVRPTGMGGAFVGLADDINALFWNPAGLAQVIGREVSFGHASLFGLISVESLAYSQPVGGGVGAIDLNYANYGNVEQFDLDEYENPIAQNSSLNPYAIFGSLAWSKSMTPYLALGARLKMLRENYGLESQGMGALDIGASYFTGIEDLTLGLCVQNLQIPLVARSLSIVTRLGAAYSIPWKIFFDDKFIAALDLNFPTVSPFNTAVGIEYWYHDLFALRAGYQFSEQNQYHPLRGVTAGLSVKLFFVQLDYAYLPNDQLGDTHRLSLLARFATDLEKAEWQKRQKKAETKPGAGKKRYFYQYLFSTD